MLKSGPATRGEVVAPNGKPVTLAFSKEPLDAYEGTVWLRAAIIVRSDPKAGEQPVRHKEIFGSPE